MSKLFWRALKAAPAVVAGSLVATNVTLAQSLPTNEVNNIDNIDATLDQIDDYRGAKKKKKKPLSQVTNVNQLRDVSPASWAYEALRSLVDRYGCIVGYPNQTYRGNRALSRYEFAAGLNACLNQIERLIAASEAVLREDIDTLSRLMQEFEAELVALNGRVDSLEGRVSFLEDHQFSTTTKLKGEVVFGTSNAFGDEDQGNSQATFSNRVRLNFDTSFTGKDLFRTRLQAGDVARYDRVGRPETDMARLGFDGPEDNDLEIDDLYYRFPIAEKFVFYVGANGLDIDDIFDTVNPILEASGTGSVSRFLRFDPLLFRGSEGAGGGIIYEWIPDKLTLTTLYLADDDGVGDPSEGNGLYNGSFSTGIQVGYSPLENLDLAVTYRYQYQSRGNVNLTGSTGSLEGRNPYADNSAARVHNVGLAVNYTLREKYNFGVWGSVAFSEELAPNAFREALDADAKYFTVGGSFSILDLIREGGVLSVSVGVPPKSFDSENAFEDDDSSVVIQGLYKFPFSDNILITPGFYVITSPDHDSDNDAEVVGIIRTTFKF